MYNFNEMNVEIQSCVLGIVDRNSRSFLSQSEPRDIHAVFAQVTCGVWVARFTL